MSLQGQNTNITLENTFAGRGLNCIALKKKTRGKDAHIVAFNYGLIYLEGNLILSKAKKMHCKSPETPKKFDETSYCMWIHHTDVQQSVLMAGRDFQILKNFTKKFTKYSKNYAQRKPTKTNFPFLQVHGGVSRLCSCSGAWHDKRT